MATHIKEIVLEDSNFPLLSKTRMNQLGIDNSGNIIGFQRLTQLQVALDALQPVPPNATTVWFDNTILLQDASMAFPSLNINPTNFTFGDATTYRIGDTNGLSYIDLFADSLNPTTNVLTLNSSTGITQLGDVNTVANGTKIVNNDTTRTIQLDACNINSFNYALPICFEKKDTGTITYGGGQPLTNVFQIDLNTLPPNFFVESPSLGYTSNIWRIVFTLQTWNNGSQNNNSDKALAYYIEFEDQNTNTYKPFMINDVTPYCKHNNNSTWTGGGSNSEFQSHSWNDYVDFTPLGGTGSGNFPLRFKIYMGSDNPKDFTFTFVLGLTRTNLI